MYVSLSLFVTHSNKQPWLQNDMKLLEITYFIEYGCVACAFITSSWCTCMLSVLHIILWWQSSLLSVDGGGTWLVTQVTGCKKCQGILNAGSFDTPRGPSKMCVIALGPADIQCGPADARQCRHSHSILMWCEGKLWHRRCHRCYPKVQL